MGILILNIRRIYSPSANHDYPRINSFGWKFDSPASIRVTYYLTVDNVIRDIAKWNDTIVYDIITSRLWLKFCSIQFVPHCFASLSISSGTFKLPFVQTHTTTVATIDPSRANNHLKCPALWVAKPATIHLNVQVYETFNLLPYR